MNLFSSQSDKEQKNMSQDIPDEILSAVSIMGASPVQSAPRTENEVSTLKPSSTPRQGSPFLSEDSVVKEPVSDRQSQPVPFSSGENSLKDGELKPLFDKNTASEPQTGRWNKMLLGVFGGTIIIILGGLAAWYFMKPAPEEAIVSPRAEIVITPVEPAVVSEPPFSLNTANYLSFDTETVTAESFQTLIQQSAGRMLSANMTQPVEFLLTDKNNNPIAFSRFAYLMKLNLPEELLAVLGESFSLFLYNDGGKVVSGLELTLTDTVAAQKLLTQKEVSLPAFFQPLLFIGNVLPKEVVFRSGMYNAQPVRFVNIDQTQNVSFDYAVRGNEWLIGTSKDTLRAMLDKQ